VGGGRHKARLVAIQELYRREVGGDKSGIDIDLPDDIADSSLRRNADQPFVQDLVQGVSNAGGALDELIGQASENYPVARMTVMDRLILRLATYELQQHRQVSRRIIINEALELARSFADESSVRFINGVLDRLARTIRGDHDTDAQEDGPA